MINQLSEASQTNDSSAFIEPKGKPGRKIGSTNLHAKHPSSISKRLSHHGVDWVERFAMAIKASTDYSIPAKARVLAREDIRMWLRLIPYLVTTTNRVRAKKWKGRASKAAIAALNELEGR